MEGRLVGTYPVFNAVNDDLVNRSVAIGVCSFGGTDDYNVLGLVAADYVMFRFSIYVRGGGYGAADFEVRSLVDI